MNLVSIYDNYINSLKKSNIRGMRSSIIYGEDFTIDTALNSSNILDGINIYGIDGIADTNLISAGVSEGHLRDAGLINGTIANTIEPLRYVPNGNQNIEVTRECNIFLNDGTVIRARGCRIEMVE